MLYLAITKTNEIKVEKVDDAHALLDKLAGTAAAAETWTTTHYPNAYLLYQEMKERGELPSLKSSALQRTQSGEPKPPAAPAPAPVPPPTPV